MQSQTIKSNPLETVRSDADEYKQRRIDFSNACERRLNLSPLARAALANGVSFADVSAYCEGRNCTSGFPDALYAALVSSDIAECKREAVTLDAALARSVLAQGTIEHARLWWRGVL